MEILEKKTSLTFFEDLNSLNTTQTSLFLLNYINLFKSISGNKCILTYLYENGLVNSYLFNDDIRYHYNNSIYLVFKKDFKYENNILFNKKKCSIIEFLENSSKCLDYYDDNKNLVFTVKTGDLFVDNLEHLLNGDYLKLSYLKSTDVPSSFVNNILNKKGLYKAICNELQVKYVNKPFLKLDSDNESYSEFNFKSISSNDFKVLKKYSI